MNKSFFNKIEAINIDENGITVSLMGFHMTDFLLELQSLTYEIVNKIILPAKKNKFTIQYSGEIKETLFKKGNAGDIGMFICANDLEYIIATILRIYHGITYGINHIHIEGILDNMLYSFTLVIIDPHIKVL